jgi:hypothetical protein
MLRSTHAPHVDFSVSEPGTAGDTARLPTNALDQSGIFKSPHRVLDASRRHPNELDGVRNAVRGHVRFAFGVPPSTEDLPDMPRRPAELLRESAFPHLGKTGRRQLYSEDAGSFHAITTARTNVRRAQGFVTLDEIALGAPWGTRSNAGAHAISA